ncbi:hypothetical protein [Bdellovibrio sp. HCB274]|uniref:hypothetical protein n=1 Tax=Bdellovibrio sp. HCB274 TaxID=3394361 RepID=UPI0039B6E596
MLNKVLYSLVLFFANPAHADQLVDFGFGLSHEEMVAQGYRSVVKSSGNMIYEKKSEQAYKKMVSLKNDHVTTVYRDQSGVYFQHTKLDESGNVLGLAECKYQKESNSTACDIQTVEICQELLHKIDTGSFGFDLKKIQECADLSSKISYNRKSIDGFLPEVQKNLVAVYPGAQNTVVKAPAVSLQTLLKDYAACKKAETHLATQSGNKAATKESAATQKGQQ